IRFVKSTTHYARLDGQEIAQSWADLTDGTLDVPININEFGGVSVQTDVWTGTAAGGTPLSDNCQSWTSGSSNYFAYEGRNDAADFNWTARSFVFSSYCGIQQRLYCFE